MAVVHPRLTYEDMLTAPNDGKRYELCGRERPLSPPPKPRRKAIVANLIRLLGDVRRVLLRPRRRGRSLERSCNTAGLHLAYHA